MSYADHFNHTCCGFSFPNIRFTISSSDIMMVTSPLATKKRSLKFLTQKHAQRPTYKFHQRPSLVQILTIDSELDWSVPVLSIHHPYTFLPTWSLHFEAENSFHLFNPSWSILKHKLQMWTFIISCEEWNVYWILWTLKWTAVNEMESLKWRLFCVEFIWLLIL